jgi:hypothetical protein
MGVPAAWLASTQECCGDYLNPLVSEKRKLRASSLAFNEFAGKIPVALAFWFN